MRRSAEDGWFALDDEAASPINGGIDGIDPASVYMAAYEMVQAPPGAMHT